MYENVQWINVNNQNVGIRVIINGIVWSVPLDPANTDYQNIMKLVEEGKLTIQPAEENK